MVDPIRTRARTPWALDILASLAASLVTTGLITGLVIAVAPRLVPGALAGRLPTLGLLALTLALPSGAAGGLVILMVFRGRRPRREGRLLWEAQVGRAAALGVLAGAVTASLLLPVLLPMFWRVVTPSATSPTDSLMDAVFPLGLTGALAGGAGAFVASFLHRPRKRRPLPELPLP